MQKKLHKFKSRLTLTQRVKAFKKAHPNYLPPRIYNGALYVFWVVGSAHHQGDSYYGTYPHSALERLTALFPDCDKVGHLFSGTVQDKDALTYDINPEYQPSICDDVRNILNYSQEFGELDLVIADPPYEEKDFERYNRNPFKKQKTISDLGEIMKTGSYLAWLDVIVPVYNRDVWALRGNLGMATGTNTRIRCWTIWERR